VILPRYRGYVGFPSPLGAMHCYDEDFRVNCCILYWFHDFNRLNCHPRSPTPNGGEARTNQIEKLVHFFSVLRLFPVAAVVRFRVDYVDRLFVSRSCVLEVLGEYFFHYALIPVYALRAVHAALWLFGFFVHIISVGYLSD